MDPRGPGPAQGAVAEARVASGQNLGSRRSARRPKSRLRAWQGAAALGLELTRKAVGWAVGWLGRAVSARSQARARARAAG